MKKTQYRLPQKSQHIQPPTLTRRQYRPKTFMPLITPMTTNSLCHHPIQDQRPNRTLRDIVRRLYQRRLINEKKITLTILLKSLGQHRRLLVRRNTTTNRFHNRLFIPTHQTLKTYLHQCILSMNSSKHLLDILQQTLAVSTRTIKRGKELYLTNRNRSRLFLIWSF